MDFLSRTWRPITSAPKDGRMVMLRWPNGEDLRGQWFKLHDIHEGTLIQDEFWLLPCVSPDLTFIHTPEGEPVEWRPMPLGWRIQEAARKVGAKLWWAQRWFEPAEPLGVFAAALALSWWAVAFAGVQPPIRFSQGASAATVENAVVRGDRDIYRVTAKAGQVMRVRITSIENNVVFQVYGPGAAYRQADGIWEFSGPALPGAGELDDATAWMGRLRSDGSYLIVVGGTRGNAGYRLSVWVH